MPQRILHKLLLSLLRLAHLFAPPLSAFAMSISSTPGALLAVVPDNLQEEHIHQVVVVVVGGCVCVMGTRVRATAFAPSGCPQEDIPAMKRALARVKASAARARRQSDALHEDFELLTEESRA